jgi:hypothetical protein
MIKVFKPEYFDTMQLCINGHFITDQYNDQPLSRKEFCTSCGAKTIHQCQNCGKDIKGKHHVPGLVNRLGSRTPVPNICEYCGKNFPWRKTNAEEHQMTTPQFPDIKDEKKEEWYEKISKAEAHDVITQLLQTDAVKNNVETRKEVINLSSRWQVVRDARNKGLEDFEKVSRMMNQINDALVDIIHHLK